MRNAMIVPLCLAAAACSGGDEGQKKAAAETPATIPAGTWNTEAEVKSFASADKSATPALKAKQGDKEQASVCVTEAQRARPDPILFAGPGYSCTYSNDYVKGGTINALLACTRPELKGQVNMSVQGSYTADEFEVTVDSTSFLPGDGDFKMSRKVKGKLTPGACLPTAPVAGAGAAAPHAAGKGGKAGG